MDGSFACRKGTMAGYDKLSCWLLNSVNESDDERYRHRLLEENISQRCEILENLKIYVQAAHEDARRRLRKLAGISLDPLGSTAVNDPAEGYPERLHIRTLKGYFGEVFAGIIAENFSPFEQDGWKVPAFLFRFHLVEFQQLEAMRQTDGEADLRPGRTGDDCLAFQLDGEGRIARSLYCEAKCTPDHSNNMIVEAHAKVSEAVLVDVPQLIEILEEYDDPVSSQWVKALRQLWLQGPSDDYERCDLVSYVCGCPPVRDNRRTWIPVDKPHEKYTAGRRLEAVEAHLQDVEGLVRQVYSKNDAGNGPTR
jgi:hypothetical protein